MSNFSYRLDPIGDGGGAGGLPGVDVPLAVLPLPLLPPPLPLLPLPPETGVSGRDPPYLEGPEPSGQTFWIGCLDPSAMMISICV